MKSTLFLLLVLCCAARAQLVGNPYVLVYADSLRTVLCATQLDGVFRSVDNGKSWRSINAGLEKYLFVYNVIADPYVVDQYYGSASVSGAPAELVESTDGGAHWRAVPGPEVADWYECMIPIPWSPGGLLLTNEKNIWRGDRYAGTWRAYGTPDTCAPALIAASPADTGVVYLTTETRVVGKPIVGRLYVSAHGGDRWTRLLDSLGPPIHKLFPDPADARHLFVVSKQILETMDGGATWDTLPLPPGSAGVTIGGYHWTSKRWYAAAWYDSVWTTSDAGRTWRAMPLGGNSYITDIVVDPNDACHAYILRVDGLWETHDCGMSVSRNGFTITSAEAAPAAEKNAISLTVHPNPIFQRGQDQVLRCEIVNTNIDPAHISIRDLFGRCFYSSTLTSASGTRSIDITLGNVQPGLYLVRIESGPAIATTKLIIL